MLFIVFFVLALCRADTLVGCYSQIDAVKTPGQYQFQTPSYCVGQCNTPYVAISQGNMCYCLNSEPTSDEASSSQCNVPCFGYGQEMCGGASTFSVYVGNADAQVEDVSSSASSRSVSPSTSSSVSSRSSSSTASSSSVTAAPGSASEEATTSTDSSQSSVIFRTVTQSDTASSTASSSATGEPDDQNSNNSKKSSNVGPIVGGVVGGIAAVVLIGLAIFFIIRYKRQEEDEDEEEYFDKPTGGTIRRNNGTFKAKGSTKNNALDMPMTNPFDHPQDEFADRRKTALVDPRLNPVMLGRRRLSEGSLADETDYSRKILQVANPE